MIFSFIIFVVLLNVLLLDPQVNKPYRISKDTSGGYGTGNDFGDKFFSAILKRALKAFHDRPPLFAAYVFSVLTIIYAPLSLTASARYSVIIFGMIFGYIILNEIPSNNMIIGAIIISLSGLFVIKRQKELGELN